MNDALEILAVAALILAISFGCSHCEKSEIETDIMRQQLKQMEKQ